MTHLSSLVGRPLKWNQPSSFARTYELRAGPDVAGTLVFRSMFGTLATAQCADGCWTFKRMGFLQTRVTIRCCGSDEEVAVFRNQTWGSGGTLELADGRRLQTDTNAWQSNLQFFLEWSEPLVRFNMDGTFHLNATVEVAPRAIDMPELPLLVMLGWYLVVMMQSDQGTSAAIIG